MIRIIEWIEGESEMLLDGVLIIHTLAAARRNAGGGAGGNPANGHNHNYSGPPTVIVSAAT